MKSPVQRPLLPGLFVKREAKLLNLPRVSLSYLTSLGREVKLLKFPWEVKYCVKINTIREGVKKDFFSDKIHSVKSYF